MAHAGDCLGRTTVLAPVLVLPGLGQVADPLGGLVVRLLDHLQVPHLHTRPCGSFSSPWEAEAGRTDTEQGTKVRGQSQGWAVQSMERQRPWAALLVEGNICNTAALSLVCPAAAYLPPLSHSVAPLLSLQPPC